MSNISVTTHGVLVTGLEGRIVPIKVEYEPGGLPALDIHGGKEANARDARVRVRSALDSIKHPLAGRAKVVIPDDADAGLDLPIALACLIAMGVVPNPSHGVVAFGEVSLMGAIRPVRGAFNRLEAIQAKGHYALLPKASAHEAWDGPPFHAAADLAEALDLLAEPAPSWPEDRRSTHGRPTDQHDFSQVHPRNPARRGLEIAAVGGHNVLMTGQPGTGGIMFARRMTSILPPMTLDERREVTRIQSVAGIHPDYGQISIRPFRAPHHTVSEAGLLGGGHPARPGEVTLAHHGVLLLDEAPEFRRTCLDWLVSALRVGHSNVTRASSFVKFPAAPMVIAAMNPCPCSRTPCVCRPERATTYRERLGTLLPMLPVRLRLAPWDHAGPGNGGESSAVIQARVVAARAFGAARTGKALDGSTWTLLKRLRTPGMIAVARTIADMDRSGAILQRHGEEAEALFHDYAPVAHRHATA